MKYKVGERVKVRSLKWYNINKNKNGDIDVVNHLDFVAEMLGFCGKTLIIDKIVKEEIDHYLVTDLEGNPIPFLFEDYMLEDADKDLRSLLKPGLFVETANKNIFIVIEDEIGLLLSSTDFWIGISKYDSNLINSTSNENTINKIIKPRLGYSMKTYMTDLAAVSYNVIWERPKEIVELTMDEIADKFGISVEQLKIKK